MRVDVSGHQFEFPQQCACCATTANTVYTVSASRSRGTRVVRTTTKKWDIPYCSRCIAHVALYGRAKSSASLCAVVTILIAVLFHNAFSFFVIVAGAMLTYAALLHFQQKARLALST